MFCCSHFRAKVGGKQCDYQFTVKWDLLRAMKEQKEVAQWN